MTLKMKRGAFAPTLDDGREADDLADLDALISPSGKLAIHKWGMERTYRVSHVPTGGVIRRGFGTLKGARAFVEMVDGLDWDFDDANDSDRLAVLWPAIRDAFEQTMCL